MIKCLQSLKNSVMARLLFYEVAGNDMTDWEACQNAPAVQFVFLRLYAAFGFLRTCRNQGVKGSLCGAKPAYYEAAYSEQSQIIYR